MPRSAAQQTAKLAKGDAVLLELHEFLEQHPAEAAAYRSRRAGRGEQAAMIGERLLDAAASPSSARSACSGLLLGRVHRSKFEVQAEPVKGRPVAREAVGRGNACVYTRVKEEWVPSAESGTGDDRRVWFLTLLRKHRSNPNPRKSGDL